MMNRRRFLHYAGAGTALLTMPQFLASCAKNGASTLPPTAPENPFMAWFGVDEAMLRRVMAELTSRGATHADAYFQHTRSNTVVMEDGIVSQAYSNIEQGVGLRVVVGDQVGYAFTEELTEDAMRAAARTAAAIATGKPGAPPQRFSFRADDATYYKTTVPWSEVGIDQKLPRIQKAETLARAGDPSIKKVTIYWADSEERVMVVNKDGRIVTDMRPMARMFGTSPPRRTASGSRTARTSRVAAAWSCSTTRRSRRSRAKPSIARWCCSTRGGRLPASCR